MPSSRRWPRIPANDSAATPSSKWPWRTRAASCWWKTSSNNKRPNARKPDRGGDDETGVPFSFVGTKKDLARTLVSMNADERGTPPDFQASDHDVRAADPHAGLLVGLQRAVVDQRKPPRGTPGDPLQDQPLRDGGQERRWRRPGWDR